MFEFAAIANYRLVGLGFSNNQVKVFLSYFSSSLSADIDRDNVIKNFCKL